jgi:hypothetical protein
MNSQYKFVCGSCKLECISCIGTEVGPNYLVVPMACSSCATIESYTLAKPGSIDPELSDKPVCKTCHSLDYLVPWDGLTCPSCNSHMRAIRNPIGTKRPFRHW